MLNTPFLGGQLLLRGRELCRHLLVLFVQRLIRRLKTVKLHLHVFRAVDGRLLERDFRLALLVERHARRGDADEARLQRRQPPLVLPAALDAQFLMLFDILQGNEQRVRHAIQLDSQLDHVRHAAPLQARNLVAEAELDERLLLHVANAMPHGLLHGNFPAIPLWLLQAADDVIGELIGAAQELVEQTTRPARKSNRITTISLVRISSFLNTARHLPLAIALRTSSSSVDASTGSLASTDASACIVHRALSFGRPACIIY
mmetsp:Transcript_181/g.554  ORF Transcript_181/g.554 Transcript_181/m.554 type:complete len:260 (+) Transcript_181:549-1328(+)